MEAILIQITLTVKSRTCLFCGLKLLIKTHAEDMQTSTSFADEY